MREKQTDRERECVFVCACVSAFLYGRQNEDQFYTNGVRAFWQSEDGPYLHPLVFEITLELGLKLGILLLWWVLG